MKRRKLVKNDGDQILEIKLERTDIKYDEPKRDDGVTLWNLVNDYVKERWPDSGIDHWNGGITVFDTFVVIDEEKYQAADPKFFEHIDAACKKGAKLSKGRNRKGLRSAWSMEAVVDLHAIHAIDTEEALEKLLGDQIADEIDRGIIGDLDKENGI